MKKVLTIPLIVLVLFSGISLKYSAHMCGGTLVATKFSLNGSIATCSMEENNTEYPGIDLFQTNCCDNIFASLQLKTNYIPSSTYSAEYVSAPASYILSALDVPQTTRFISNFTKSGIWPPGCRNFDSCSPESLCILRI